VISTSFTPQKAPGWQAICSRRFVMQAVVTSWLHLLDTHVFYAGMQALVTGGTNVSMLMVTTLRSGVYHLLP